MTRATLYRVLHGRGHPAITCLRCAYGWHGASVTTSAAEHAALARIQTDMESEDFERALIRASLCLLPCDQTLAVCLCDGNPDVDESHQLFAVWGPVYGELDFDQALDFAAAVLYEQRWCPADGAARGARYFATAEKYAAYDLEAEASYALLLQAHDATMKRVTEATRKIFHERNERDADLNLTGRNWVTWP